IAKMRKNGQAASEILLTLSCKHPVNVDIAHEIETAQIELPVIENDPLIETLLPIVKQQNDKMERMLSHELHDAAEIWHRNQLDGNKLLKQSARWILLVVALMMTLVVAFFFTYTNMFDDSKLKSENDILNLQNELRRQQKSFRAMIVQYNKLIKEERQNDTMFFKGAVGKERSSLVKKIDELIRQGAQDKYSKDKESFEILDLKEKLFELKQKVQALEKGKLQAEQAVKQIEMIKAKEKNSDKT
ncbi:MAG: hypothetical protein KOO69_00390, partial [Victivallales bacterium]|nr:hypothetical protein [Victivallales bacterium]